MQLRLAKAEGYDPKLTHTPPENVGNSASNSDTHIDRVLRVPPSRGDSPQDMPNVARLADQNVCLSDKVVQWTRTATCIVVGAGVG